jgi:hypothetical protein
MLKNCIIIALRNLIRNSVPTFINLFGLSVAVGCCIVVYLFAHSNLTKNAFHENAERIFMVERITGDGRAWGDVPVPLGPALKVDFPQALRTVRLAQDHGTLGYESVAIEERIRFVDAGFFDMFTFPMKHGTPTALSDPGALILSAETARKYFGEENPQGRRMNVIVGDRVAALTVGGVTRALPVNAGLDFEVLIGYDSPLNQHTGKSDDWSARTTATFIQVNAPEDIAVLSSQMNRYVARGNTTEGDDRLAAYEFGNLLKINRDGRRVRGSVIGGVTWTAIRSLSALAGFILLMSCVNYINIALAAANRRLREIGVRKVMGGLRRQIVAQFLTENLILCLITLIMGVEIAHIFLIPAFNDWGGVNLALFYGNSLDLILFLVIFLIGLSIASGAYPAFYISSFQPVVLLRQKRKTGGARRIMQGFLTVQFILAFIATLAGVVFISNSRYLEQRDWGYDPSNTLVIRLWDVSRFGALRDEATRLSGARAVAGSRDQIGVTEREIQVMDRDSALETVCFDVSADYAKTLGLRLKSGLFAQAAGEIVINETFARARGWTDPLGKTVRIEDAPYTVVGVVEDFFEDGFFQEIEPVAFRLTDESAYRFLSIRVAPGAGAGAAQALQDAWNRLWPDVPFEHFFQHTVFDEKFMENRTITSLYTFEAFVALLIACLSCSGWRRRTRRTG